MRTKHIVLTSLFLFVFFFEKVIGQTKNPLLIGIQPSITIEPFYEEGELDINLLPLVIEMPIGKRLDFRLLPTANYHFGGMNNGFSDIGLYAVLPFFLKKRESKEMRPVGFYCGPVIGFGRNLLNNHYTTTIAIEPGYMFEAKKSFTLTLGVQLGTSYFAYDYQPNKWVLHWGPKVTFGFWLSRK